MKLNRLKFVLVLTLGVVVSFLLVPGKQERALMFLKDWRYQQAQGLYEELQDLTGPKRSNLMPLTHIYLGEGDINSAIKMHEQYLHDYPNDTEVWEMLADLYHDTQRLYDSIEILENLVEKKPDSQGYTKLLRLYEQTGMKDEKMMKVLVKLVELNPELERETRSLINILAGSGRLSEASLTIDQYVRRFPEAMNDDMAEFRLRLLLANNRISEALDWAKHWSDDSQDVQLRFIALLYSLGLSSDMNTALQTDITLPASDMPVWMVAAIMKRGWGNDDQTFIDNFVSSLREDVKAEFPVTMAMLAFKRGDNSGFEYWLEKTAQKKDLSVNQQSRLVILYFMSGNTTSGLQLLSSLSSQSAISASTLAQSVPFILKSDGIEKAQLIFQEIASNSSDEIITTSWALLTTALGKTSDITAWLDSEAKGLSQSFMLEMYQIAVEKSHYRLAALIAERIYHRYQVADKISGITSYFLAKEKNANNKKQLLVLLKKQINLGFTSAQMRRQLAFVLLDAGEKQASINVFKSLAEKEGPQGANVKQLLFIWGPLPGDQALDWIEERARKAPARQLAAWWKHLSQAGGSRRVIMMAKEMQVSMPEDAEEVLISILTANGDTSVVNLLLRQRAGKTSNPASLEKLASHARHAGLAKAEEVIWQRLYRLDSNNPRAIKALGIGAYSRGDMQKAVKYLQQYSQLSGGDWESLFYLGEALGVMSKDIQAKAMLKKSLEFIELDAWPQKRKRVVKAYLLYRLGYIRDAMALYEKLMRRYPDDIELKADYSTMLIEVGRLDKAHEILGGRK